MDYHFRCESGLLTISFSIDRIDTSNSQELKSAIRENWQPGIERVDIEMAPIRFIDSSGIGALLGIFKLFENEKRGPVRLLNPQPGVMSVVELLRLHQVFQFG